MYFDPQTLKPGYGSDSAQIDLQLGYFVSNAIRPPDVA